MYITLQDENKIGNKRGKKLKLYIMKVELYNTPTLLLYGIQQEPMQLVNNIRQRVQIQRKENKIYEITNR